MDDVATSYSFLTMIHLLKEMRDTIFQTFMQCSSKAFPDFVRSYHKTIKRSFRRMERLIRTKLRHPEIKLDWNALREEMKEYFQVLSQIDEIYHNEFISSAPFA